MVDVCMGDQNKIDLANIEAKIQRGNVLRMRLRASLKHAAIDEKAYFSCVDEIAGAGHFSGRAEKSDTHGVFLLEGQRE